MSYDGLPKRLFDLFLCVASSPFIGVAVVVLAISYVIAGQFPILFVQWRSGKNGKPFKMYKFRTLSDQIHQPLSQRRFLLGDFLRYTSLDELPQVWNVVKGEMSWIGPRPLPVEYLKQMTEHQKIRYRVLPGITGLAQVNGKNSISWAEKFTFDLCYVAHISFLLDVKIIGRTIWLLLSFQKDQSLHEPKFNG